MLWRRQGVGGAAGQRELGFLLSGVYGLKAWGSVGLGLALKEAGPIGLGSGARAAKTSPTLARSDKEEKKPERIDWPPWRSQN